jgi:potassium/hydrogen antiporter
VDDATRFGLVIGLVSGAMLLAVVSSRLSERIRIPAPAIFLVAAAIASDLLPALGRLPVQTVQRVVTVALVALLFDGGMHIGRRKFRLAAGAIAWIGVVGTFATTGGLAVVAHYLLGLDWLPAFLIGTALAPTDPATVFSVLGRREIAGRSGVLLEGEAGANDPVGIALMASLLAAGTNKWFSGSVEFLREMLLGGVIGVLAGVLLAKLMRRVTLPSGALYPLFTLAASGVIYGATTVLHGSGFLAVFVAGVMVGDVRAPYKAEIERFHGSLASLGEIIAFTVLGLTISLRSLLHSSALWTGLLLALVATLLVRPILVGSLLIPVKLRWGERAFISWSGLKGAVPILLGTFVLTADVEDPAYLYQVIVVVVAFSVIVQGSLVPVVARYAGVPMRTIEPEPWALGMRFQHEPHGLHRYVISAGAPADGGTLADLPLGEDSWISLVSRNGELVQVRGDTVLQAGDEVVLLGEPTNLFGP